MKEGRKQSVKMKTLENLLWCHFRIHCRVLQKSNQLCMPYYDNICVDLSRAIAQDYPHLIIFMYSSVVAFTYIKSFPFLYLFHFWTYIHLSLTLYVMRELKLVLGHGNPHFTPTFYSFAPSLSLLFLLFFLFTSTLIYHFPQPPLLPCQFRKQKGSPVELLWYVCHSRPTCILVSFFVMLGNPFQCSFWTYSPLVFQRLSSWSMFFMCCFWYITLSVYFYFSCKFRWHGWYYFWECKNEFFFFVFLSIRTALSYISITFRFNMFNLLLSFCSVWNCV